MKKLLYFFLAVALISCNKDDDQPSVKPAFQPEVSYIGGGMYHINMNGYAFSVSAYDGGRISGLQIDGEDMLSPKTINITNWGSTFWPAPQSMWNWPPPAILDSKAYSFSMHGDKVLMISAKDSVNTNLQFKKTFSPSASDNSVLVEYVIYNRGTSAVSVAPWEITRVPSGGLTFFPTGESRSGTLETDVQDSIHITWFDYSNAVISSDEKLFSDGKEGWIAHVHQGKMLLKSFPEIALGEEAPGEAEIEIYVNGAKTYEEVEQLGKYTALAPQDSLVWEVKWYAADVPQDIDISVGSEELAGFARSLIK